MLDLSFWEILIIGIACILFINPEDMPEILRQVGKAFRKFKKTLEEFTSILKFDEEEKNIKPKNMVKGLDGEYHEAYDVKEVFKEDE